MKKLASIPLSIPLSSSLVSGSAWGRAARTSVSHPLRIDWIRGEGLADQLGMSIAPGKKHEGGLMGDHDRDEARDFAVLQAKGVNAVVSLLETWEYASVKIEGQPARIREFADFDQFEVVDMKAPKPEEMPAWHALVIKTVCRLHLGQKVLVHCRGGLGRTGTLVACVLMALGKTRTRAIEVTRLYREGAIQTTEQYDWLVQYEKFLKGKLRTKLSFADMERIVDGA